MSALNEAWERFWFAEESTAPLAVFRICFGLLVMGWTLSTVGQLDDFFSPGGILPSQPADLADGAWGVLGWVNSSTAAAIVWVVLLAAAAALLVGWHARLAALLVLVGIIAFERRNPFVYNSGDALIRVLAFYLVLAPSGAALSLDRRRRARERFWEWPMRAPWAMRLVQIQISVIYLSTLWIKVRGTAWNDGTAASYALRLDDLRRLPLPDFLGDSLLLSNLMTYGTLALEASLGILVWNRRARPYVLALGVGLHLSIEYQLRIGFFSIAMLVAYLAFVPGDAMERFVAAARARLEQALEGMRARRAAPRRAARAG